MNIAILLYSVPPIVGGVEIVTSARKKHFWRTHSPKLLGGRAANPATFGAFLNDVFEWPLLVVSDRSVDRVVRVQIEFRLDAKKCGQ